MNAENLQMVPVLFAVKNIYLNDRVDNKTTSTSKNNEPSSASTSSSYVAITYEITSINMNRKFTLASNRDIRLTDEFGNEYQRLSKPANYNQPTVKKSPSFPSLYPGEIYSETVFFEAPVKATRSLILSFNATDVGINKPIVLYLDISDRTNLRSIQKKTIDPSTFHVKIVDPPSGTILNQGDVIHVRVVTAGEKPPKKIIVIALSTYYEDKSPHYENVYDLNVPIDQLSGSYVLNVIAEWPGPDPEHNITLSDTLSFDVQEAAPLSTL